MRHRVSTAVLEDLRGPAGRRAQTIVRAGSAGLFLMATGPFLAWVPLGFLERMPGPALRPLPLAFVWHRCRSGFVSRPTAGDLPPFRLLRKAVRDAALGRGG